MSRDRTQFEVRVCVVVASALAVCGFVLTAPIAAAEEPAGVVGRAVSVRGTVHALAEGQPPRVLSCRDPIFDGDKIVTQKDAAIGIDSGTYYARLDEKSELRMSALASGAPKLGLELGHVRLLDSAGSANASAELTTPGLRVARTGPDQDALVFGEKATAVSMVCAYEIGIDVARAGKDDEHLAAEPGRCVVGKPREPLYAQEATHPTLAVLMQDQCEDPGLPVAGRFTPTSVAMGPPGSGSTVAPPPDPSVFAQNGLNVACAPTCQQPALPTQFPFLPPILP